MLLCSCGDAAPTVSPEAEPYVIRVGALTGPTAMGMVKLMYDNGQQLTQQSYEFSLQSEASAFSAALVKGEIDIAAVPANLASILYNNTEGEVRLLAVNTLGVLYIVERGESIRALSDLEGRTLYATGEGAVPEFTLRCLMSESGTDDGAVDIHWCADTTEALSYLSADENAAAMLPQPFVTAAQAKLSDLRIALDLNAEWEKYSGGTSAVTGVILARRDFVESHQSETEIFLSEYQSSVSYVADEPDDTAELIGEYGIVSAEIARAALPYCHIMFISGSDMKAAVKPYLSALYAVDPKAVGGALPEDDFYYGAE